MTTDNIKKIILLIVLILVFGIIQLFIKNNIIAISLLGVMIIGILIYLKRSNTISKRQKNKIIRQGKRVRARILSVKDYQRNSIILSLQIEHPDKFYVTSYIITKADQEVREKYKPDQQLNVFVNQKNHYEVIIPEDKKVRTPITRTSFWGLLSTLGIIALSVGVPLIISLFDTSDREFKDIAFVHSGNQENIWEIRFESPKKIFFKIYNPATNKKIKSFRDKKDMKLDHNTNFFISQRGHNVFIIGTGNTPVIDVYDATSFTKISDIKDFEKTNSILGDGIASVRKWHMYYKFNKDDFIDITTNDGEKCLYDIQLDKFFDSENDVREFIEESDFAVIANQMFVFALSNVPNSENKHKLYLIEAKNKKVLETLKGYAGSTSFDVKYFNSKKKYQYKDLNLTLLAKDRYFLKGKFLYFDAYLAIIHHVNGINKDAEELISGIDKSGTTLFSFKESDYPNVDDMKDDNFHPINSQKLEVIRLNEKFVFLFGKYGALCIDSNIGKIIWKYEP